MIDIFSGAMLIPANTYGDRAPFGSVGGGELTKSGSKQCTRAILPSFGPHGCVKPYCCLFVYIGFLLRSDGRYQTERESVPSVERAELADPLNFRNCGTLSTSGTAEPPLCCAWASFYTQGVTNWGQHRQEG